MLEPENEVGPDAAALDLGELLRSARRERTLSVEQAAEALRLDESVILALEGGDYEALGAAVFVRGHLKTYARLLGLSVDSVLAGYQEPTPVPEAVPVGPHETDHYTSISPNLLGFVGLGVVLTLILALYVMQDDEMAPVPMSDELAEPADLILPPELPPATRRNILIESGDRSTADDFAVAAETPVEAEIPAPAVELSYADEEIRPADIEAAPLAPRPSQMRLSLLFNQESWVEISDANQRLLFGLQHEGKRRELTGEPPFQLLLGNAEGVELMINDQPYSLPTKNLRGNVARFEIAPAAAE
jgi:cytoskeleton protein RodZ